MIHFSASGEPDGFASKTAGTLLFSLTVYPLFLVMTCCLKEPAFTPLFRFSRRGWKAFAEFMTTMALGLVFLDALLLLYNIGYASSEWISYSVWAFVGLTFLLIYRLFAMRVGGGS